MNASLALWAWVAAVGLGAGWVRGFTGFGFSVLCMAGLTWLISPSLVVPVIVVLELVASTLLGRGSIAGADRGWLKAIFVGNLIAVPAGMAMLLFLPQQPLRLTVTVLLLLAALGLRFVLRAHWPDTPRLRLGCGLGAGLMNGIAASGGVVAAMVLAASGMPGAKLRATMIIYLWFADVLVIGFMVLASVLDLPIQNALIAPQSTTMLVVLGVPMALGIYWGQHTFHRRVDVDFRRFVLNLLIVMASLSLLLILSR